LTGEDTQAKTAAEADIQPNPPVLKQLVVRVSAQGIEQQDRSEMLEPNAFH
jgi:hypothetical protein